jgi:hypothetical protein
MEIKFLSSVNNEITTQENLLMTVITETFQVKEVLQSQVLPFTTKTLCTIA